MKNLCAGWIVISTTLCYELKHLSFMELKKVHCLFFIEQEHENINLGYVWIHFVRREILQEIFYYYKLNLHLKNKFKFKI